MTSTDERRVVEIDIEKALADPEALPAGVIAALREAYEDGFSFATVVEGLAGDGYELKVVGLSGDRGNVLDRLTTTEVPEGEYPGTMVALYPLRHQAEAIAACSGVQLSADDLHITLAYLGDQPPTPEAVQKILDAVEAACAGHTALRGSITGAGHFPGKAIWAAVSVPGLAEMRTDICRALAECGIPQQSEHGYTPHMTLVDNDADYADMPDVPHGAPLDFDCAYLSVGTQKYILPLSPRDDDDVDMAQPDPSQTSQGGIRDPRRPKKPLTKTLTLPTMVTWDPATMPYGTTYGFTPTQYPSTSANTLTAAIPRQQAITAEVPGDYGVIRKEDSRRFTLGPWYVPDFEDAHGDSMTSDELQRALWNYVDHADREIRLQHNKGVVAGRWVEAVSWPYPCTVAMMQADGATQDMTFPPGTCFLGVIWEPWAYEMVKDGRITGLSLSGSATRIPE